jgi:hypothetical protein
MGTGQWHFAENFGHEGTVADVFADRNDLDDCGTFCAAALVGHCLPVARRASVASRCWRLLEPSGGPPLKRLHITVKPFERSVALVTDGVFAWTRNPKYLGVAMILAGIAALLGSFSPSAIVVPFVILIHRVFIQREERQLGDVFGVTFRQYRSRVRRWL